MNKSAPIMCERLLLLQTNDTPYWWLDLFDEIANELFDDGKRLISVEANEIQAQVKQAHEDGFWPTVVAPSMRRQQEVEQFLQSKDISAKVINAIAHEKLLTFLLRCPSKSVIEAYANDSLVIFDVNFKVALENKMQTDPFCQLMVSRIAQDRVDLNECVLVSSIKRVSGFQAEAMLEWTFSDIHKFKLWISTDEQYVCLLKNSSSDTLKSLIIDEQSVDFDDDCIELNKKQVEWVVNKFSLPSSIIEFWNKIEENPKFVEQFNAWRIGEALLMLPLTLWNWLSPSITSQPLYTASAIRHQRGVQAHKKDDCNYQPILTISNIDDGNDFMAWNIAWRVVPEVEPEVSVHHNDELIPSEHIWGENFAQLTTVKVNLTNKTILGWQYNKDANHLKIMFKDNHPNEKSNSP